MTPKTPLGADDPAANHPARKDVIRLESCDRRLGRWAGLSGLAAFLLFAVPASAMAQKPSIPKPEESLAHFVEGRFARWDRNHNDELELSEVDRLIENHSMHGRQAAVVVCLRYQMTKKDHSPNLPHERLLKLVEELDFVKSVERTARHLKTIDRELFLPTDPNLATFNQGRLGDCYLLSVIAAQVHRSPEAIREMIHPEVTGGFRVKFGDGRSIQVPPLTDSELLLGARLDNRHGSWLAVLEKSYGIIRQRERAKLRDKAARDANIVPVETLNYGHSRAIISLLTGKHTATLRLGNAQFEHVHTLLAEISEKRRLACAETGHDKTPPGIIRHHGYAILGYAVRERRVTIFDPRGISFTPQGPPGMANGYAIIKGRFAVPLDEFSSVFSNLVHETDRPLTRRGKQSDHEARASRQKPAIIIPSS